MSKFEYVYVEAGQAGGEVLVRSVNREEVDNWKKNGQPLVHYLKAMGDEGWEVADYELDNGRHWLMFRRPEPWMQKWEYFLVEFALAHQHADLAESLKNFGQEGWDLQFFRVDRGHGDTRVDVGWLLFRRPI